jgi:hypothetical protein
MARHNGQSRDTMDNPETQHTKHNTERAFRNGQSRDTTRTLLNEKQNTPGAVRYMALWYYDVKAIHCPVYKLYKLDGLIVGHIYCSARANQTYL